MIPTINELKKLKVVDLREKLSSFGLSTSGLKPELVARLHSYYEHEEEQNKESVEEPPVDTVPSSEGSGERKGLEGDEALQSEEALKLIESEQKRILEQQKELLAQRKQQQLEDEKLRQQQEAAAAAVLDEETRQKVLQQQQLIEQQRIADEQKLLQQQALAQQQLMEEKKKEEELLRQQQMALLMKQREEEEKVRQQQEMIRVQEEHKRQLQTRQPLLPTPSTPAGPLLPTPQPPSTAQTGQPVSTAAAAATTPPMPLMATPIPPPQNRGPPPVSHPPTRPLLPTPDMQDHGPPPPRGRDSEPSPPPRGPPPPSVTDNDDSSKRPVKLPQALEKVLAFKDVRKKEIGSFEDEVVKTQAAEKGRSFREVPDIEIEDLEAIEDDVGTTKTNEPANKESKNKRRKMKKKKRKKAKQKEEEERKVAVSAAAADGDDDDDDIEVEYIQEDLASDFMDPAFRHFQHVFEAFRLTDEVKPEKEEKSKKHEEKLPKKAETSKEYSDSDSDSDDDVIRNDDDKPKISKKKLRKLNRLSVAELKQLVSRPDVVEMHDVTAQDPKLLVHLKATRNTVPVPRHWCFKRKYLQGKRGIEKPPFELPDFIKRTGIMEMREALQEKKQRPMKSKMREKVRPKMGKIDIDYQKLHDAFFKWQSKPKMTIHGDLYYEGKEFETRLKEKKPGELSDDLRTALGMPVGPNAHKFPPPWLIAMQRYGPPPSYPNLKVPGLNAPIPETCSFGYHAGGWGKPPVDESGKPLYGDVFGTNASDFQTPSEEEDIDKTPWGELESESEEESEEEESSEEEDEVPDDTGLITPAEGGLITPSGITSVPAGMETPEMIELRKKKIEDAMEQGGETPQLYTILPEKKAGPVGATMMGSTYTYDVPPPTKKPLMPGSGGDLGVAVALDPSELDMDTAAIEAKYEEKVREQQNQLEKEDLSDMVAEHAAKQKKKRKQQQNQENKPSKKYKEFKF
ncbi:splicing factor 3B subunit 2-like [Saccoglossus kowalevskii]|uniref:Splicing factor 3B subunit 2-like n=1 Tax=Saccoglossus kowalevskii TaxID=10224 RepID=A0ABM0MFB0_SACKO|nr:PREDICTED: splicing factor 3B subunit 2-like [Saccoglossus kowalevskii]